MLGILLHPPLSDFKPPFSIWTSESIHSEPNRKTIYLLPLKQNTMKVIHSQYRNIRCEAADSRQDSVGLTGPGNAPIGCVV